MGETVKNNTTKSIFDDFLNQYSKSITMRFKLIPIGKTGETLKREEYLDARRHAAYPIVKDLLDKEYRKLISEVLCELTEEKSINWNALYEIIKNGEKNSNKRKNEEEKLRKVIANRLKQHPDFKKLFGKAPFGNKGFFAEQLLTESEKEAVTLFDGFSVFLTNFYKNRENYFSDGAESTAIANRIVNENFPKHFQNVEKVAKICETAPEFLEKVNEKLSEIIDWKDYFTVNGYNRALDQAGIEKYNQIVGSFNKEANLYVQQNGKDLPEGHIMKSRKTSQLTSLFKQIASERTSFIQINKFESDQEVLQSIGEFIDYVNSVGLMERLKQVIADQRNWNMNGIYISSKYLTEVSSFITKGKWSLINDALQQKNDGTERKDLQYSMEEVQNALDVINSIPGDENEVEQYFIKDWLRKLNSLLEKLEMAEKGCMDFLQSWDLQLSLKEEKIEEIKAYFDNWIQIQRYIKSFQIDEKEYNSIFKDEEFYVNLQQIEYELADLNELYNMIRNYVTQKPYSIEKMHLKFDNPTLANGWAIDKEREYGTILLRKDKKYYLAVINNHASKMTYNSTKKYVEGAYEKVVYNQFTDVKKMIPKPKLFTEQFLS